MYVSRQLRVPDDETHIAMVAIDSNGETDIVGYIQMSTWQEFVRLSNKVSKVIKKWLDS